MPLGSERRARAVSTFAKGVMNNAAAASTATKAEAKGNSKRTRRMFAKENRERRFAHVVPVHVAHVRLRGSSLPFGPSGAVRAATDDLWVKLLLLLLPLPWGRGHGQRCWQSRRQRHNHDEPHAIIEEGSCRPGLLDRYLEPSVASKIPPCSMTNAWRRRLLSMDARTPRAAKSAWKRHAK
jgi:hypothetical protein